MGWVPLEDWTVEMDRKYIGRSDMFYATDVGRPVVEFIDDEYWDGPSEELLAHVNSEEFRKFRGIRWRETEEETHVPVIKYMRAPL